MNKLADTMNIEFSENERNELILLKGLYLNKKISIIEEDNAVIDWVGLKPAHLEKINNYCR